MNSVQSFLVFSSKEKKGREGQNGAMRNKCHELNCHEHGMRKRRDQNKFENEDRRQKGTEVKKDI
jgi:hypothetical protein